jgi:hypothetical protein
LRENPKLSFASDTTMLSAIQFGRGNHRIAQLMARARGHSRTLRTVKKRSESRKGLAGIPQSQTAVHPPTPPAQPDDALLLRSARASLLIGVTTMFCGMGALGLAIGRQATQES